MSSFSFFHLHCLLVLFHKCFCFLLLTTLLPCLASRVFFLLPSLLVLFHKCFSLTRTVFLSCFMSTFFFLSFTYTVFLSCFMSLLVNSHNTSMKDRLGGGAPCGKFSPTDMLNTMPSLHTNKNTQDQSVSDMSGNERQVLLH